MATRIALADTAFRLSRRGKRPRVIAGDHLAFIRQLPSVISGARVHIEAAHIRLGSLPHGKPAPGMGEKPSDQWAVPLTAEEHRLGVAAQHHRGEHLWWAEHNIDPLVIAALLWAATGDIERGTAICQHAREFTWLR